VIPARLVAAFSHAALSPDPDLAVAALMIARLEYPKLDAGPYLDQLDAIGEEARRRVADPPAPADEAPPHVDPDRYAQVLALNEYLFGEMHFAGNEQQYEDPRNSFLNEVLERRTGIPITLALLYMEVARRAGLPVEGVNFPGHFLLRCPARHGLPDAEDLIIDAFHGGALLSRDLLRRQASARRGRDEPELSESRLLPHASKPQILARMLLNLKRVYVHMLSYPQARDVTELLIAVDPSAIDELRDRGLLAYHLKDFPAALRDLQEYLHLSGSSRVDQDQREEYEQIWEHVKNLRKRVASLN
jgi:regulator of sirC expression with transglutaminase-like and TPR domain